MARADRREVLQRRVGLLESRVLNAATIEAARYFHDQLDKARDELVRTDPCSEANRRVAPA